jgi:hypothetical protein
MKQIISEKILKILLIILFLLNIVDTGATLYWITEGFAYERNPLMQHWLDLNPTLFVYIKLFFVNFAILYLWSVRKRVLTQILIIPIIMLYSYVFILHCNIAYHVFITN